MISATRRGHSQLKVCARQIETQIDRRRPRAFSRSVGAAGGGPRCLDRPSSLLQRQASGSYTTRKRTRNSRAHAMMMDAAEQRPPAAPPPPDPPSLLGARPRGSSRRIAHRRARRRPTHHSSSSAQGCAAGFWYDPRSLAKPSAAGSNDWRGERTPSAGGPPAPTLEAP